MGSRRASRSCEDVRDSLTMGEQDGRRLCSDARPPLVRAVPHTRMKRGWSKANKTAPKSKKRSLGRGKRSGEAGGFQPGIILARVARSDGRVRSAHQPSRRTPREPPHRAAARAHQFIVLSRKIGVPITGRRSRMPGLNVTTPMILFSRVLDDALVPTGDNVRSEVAVRRAERGLERRRRDLELLCERVDRVFRNPGEELGL